MLGIKIHYKPKFNNKPILIAALPDMGNVAGLCLNFLVKKINTKIFAEIYSFWPPSVTYKKGIINYIQSSYKFYENTEYNIIFFTGDFNPSDPRRLYELCYEVLKIAEMFNVKILYSVGASLKPINTIEKLVYGAVNKPEMFNLLDKLNLQILEDEGQITGFNGLILGIAQEFNLDGICLLGEIDNPNVIQPKTSQAILKVLLEIINLSFIDLSELEEEEKRKRFMEKQMNYFNRAVNQNELPGIT
ncbi:MAG TPA: PAC2 family protein [Nitrososphaeraceae archaeon]|nr:PAC2 family protein [Nitrososphaeraceae archaeon]